MNCNSAPSRELPSSSIKLDQQAWHAHESRQRFSLTPRSPTTTTNCHLQTATPADFDNSTINSHAKRFHFDLPQCTTFPDALYATKPSLAEEVEMSPLKMASMRSTAPKTVEVEVLGHNLTRLTHMTPSTSADLGPGCYDTDPYHERRMGTLTISRSERLVGTQLSRDPRCRSASFAGLERDTAAGGSLVLHHMAANPPPYLGPDFRPWTSRSAAVMKRERWSTRSQDGRPAGAHRMCESELSMDGRPATVGAFVSSRPQCMSSSFKSQLANHGVLLPGQKADTRVKVQSYAHTTATGPDLGPGSYDSEQVLAMAPASLINTSPPGPMARHLAMMALLRGTFPGHVELPPPQMRIGEDRWCSSRSLHHQTPRSRASQEFLTIPYVTGKPSSQRHYLKAAADLRQERAKLKQQTYGW